MTELKDMSAAAQLALMSDSPLTLLVGPPGSGKTRALTEMASWLRGHGELCEPFHSEHHPLTFDARSCKATMDLKGVVSSLPSGLRAAAGFNTSWATPLESLGDGVLGVLALWQALQSAQRGQVVLIDSFGAHFHSKLAEAATAEARRLATKVGFNIIAATHYPDVVDMVRMEDVVCCASDGEFYAKLLSEYPKAEEWQDVLRTGEFLASVGEGWILPPKLTPKPPQVNIFGFSAQTHPIAWKYHQAERIARRFHEVYEEEAPRFDYETRKASAVPWEDVPSSNKDLMTATVEALIEQGVIQPGEHWATV